MREEGARQLRLAGFGEEGDARLGMVDGEEAWGGLRSRQVEEVVAVGECGPEEEGHVASGGERLFGRGEQGGNSQR